MFPEDPGDGKTRGARRGGECAEEAYRRWGTVSREKEQEPEQELEVVLDVVPEEMPEVVLEGDVEMTLQ